MLNLLEELDNWVLRGMVISSSFPLVESMEHQGCQIFPSQTLLAMTFSEIINNISYKYMYNPKCNRNIKYYENNSESP